MTRCDLEYDAIVVGLGQTGLACLRHLHARGLRVAAVDTRAAPPGEAAARRELPELDLVTGPLDPAFLGRARQLVVSPGLSVHTSAIRAARDAGVEIVGDIELFAREVACPVIAITGSNGKSTVTRLLEHMGRESGLDVVAGGNIGTPALALLERPGPAACVLELSSFQLETTRSLHPAVATVLNLSHDHMDRYPDFAAYRAAKRRVHAGARALVVNRDDPHSAPERPFVDVWSFGLEPPETDRDLGLREEAGTLWLARGNQRLLEAGALRLHGRHNLANVLAALALAGAMGWDLSACAAAATRFAGLAHRMECLGRHGGVSWINDSKATNVGATVAALSGIDPPVVLIAGGDGKGADFTPLGAALGSNLRALILFGRDAPRIAAVVDPAVRIERVADLAAAVREAASLATAGDTVLFSPACASYDMFRDYQARGEAFRAAVEALS